MQLLYLDLFELSYTDLRQYIWVPRQSKLKQIVQLANCRINKELYAR